MFAQGPSAQWMISPVESITSSRHALATRFNIRSFYFETLLIDAYSSNVCDPSGSGLLLFKVAYQILFKSGRLSELNSKSIHPQLK